MSLRWFLAAAVLGVLLFPCGARANLDTGEETDSAHNHDSYLVITSPAPRSAATAGEMLHVNITVNFPFDGYNGIGVQVARARLRGSDGYNLKEKPQHLAAARRKDGTYVVAFKLPADYSGWLWLMPEDIGDGLFSARMGHYLLIEVKPRPEKSEPGKK
jgi:hypothetical protein